MKIYVLTLRWYDNRKIKTFENRKEWEEEIDSTASEGIHAGKGESFGVAIYEAPSDSNITSWSGMIPHRESRDRYATIDSIPDDWELIDEQEVSYYTTQFDKKSKKWLSDTDSYNTEEELHLAEAPSQYLCI